MISISGRSLTVSISRAPEPASAAFLFDWDFLGWEVQAPVRCLGVSAVPKILRARRPADEAEEQKVVRKLAGARHAPADWSERTRMVELSWDGLGVPAIVESFASVMTLVSL